MVINKQQKELQNKIPFGEKEGKTYTKRLTPLELEYWIPFLIARDGPICNECKSDLQDLEHKIEIDHIDNDPRNNPKDGSNYQLLCKRCNVTKENNFYSQQWKKWLEIRPYTPEMKANLRAEPKWSNWAINEIVEKGSLCQEEAIASGAYLCNVSVETTKRYLRKRLSLDGIFELGWGKCQSQNCDETHVYFKGGSPKLEN